MATTTSNYELTKPATTDNYDIGVPNGNMDKIDTQMKANADNIAAHTSDSSVHVTAAQKEAWTGKAEKSDIPTSLPANGGHAATADSATSAGTSANTTSITGALTLSTSEPTDTLAAGTLWGVYSA